jgi:uncharacterized MAPEG superfamily protein
MPSPLACLVGFALWAILLVLAIGLTRVSQVLAGKKRANEFPSGTQHGGDRYWRLNRAHVNTVENLPIFAAIILAGTWLHVDSRMFLTLPVVVLGARFVQSLTHIASGSSRAVSLRFAAFVLQVTCNGVLAVEVLRVAV